MKLFALMGDLFLLTYVIVLLVMTVMNISRALFDPYVTGDDGYGFLARQGMLIIWPITIFSTSGQRAFAIIWKGETQ